ncbi:MAG: NADH-quinone oxidoreductase subunit C [Gammaproteobacteria bacterium]|nr:NADH-quinone oxidoreductase subunit C [Gammaproteobacteria bacterium]
MKTRIVAALKDRLQQTFGNRILTLGEHVGQVTMEVAAADLLDVCTTLRDDASLAFHQLTDLCGVDYSTYGRADWETASASTAGFSRGVDRGIVKAASADEPRFCVVYHLLSFEHNKRLRVRAATTDDPPRIPSVIDIWPAADWFEREAFDMYGILFDGHPDLRRILTDYGFIGHPFRKDFPLEGHVEVRYDEQQGRVIYQPVTIENRVLVPRVIRGEQNPLRPADTKEA